MTCRCNHCQNIYQQFSVLKLLALSSCAAGNVPKATLLTILENKYTKHTILENCFTIALRSSLLNSLMIPAPIASPKTFKEVKMGSNIQSTPRRNPTLKEIQQANCFKLKQYFIFVLLPIWTVNVLSE
jgi:hypothetical protein